jgi:hypothetical protein
MRGKVLGADERLVIVTEDGERIVVAREDGAELFEAFDVWTATTARGDWERAAWNHVETMATEYLESIDREDVEEIAAVDREPLPTADQPQATTPQPTVTNAPVHSVWCSCPLCENWRHRSKTSRVPGEVQPAVESRLLDLRLGAIHKTLAEVGARGLGIFDGPNGSELKLYAVGGTVVIVQVFAGQDGYEVYAPIVDSNSITATMDAIRALAQR